MKLNESMNKSYTSIGFKNFINKLRLRKLESFTNQSQTTNNSTNLSDSISMAKLGSTTDVVLVDSNVSLVGRPTRMLSDTNSLAFKRQQKRFNSITSTLRNNENPANAAVPADGYTRDALMKKLIDDFDLLDRDMHFEFCEIRNPNNKTFEDSLKIQNERKSRYKHVYPCKDIFFNFHYIESYLKYIY